MFAESSTTLKAYNHFEHISLCEFTKPRSVNLTIYDTVANQAEF